MIGLVEPPREIPLAVQLTLLAHRDVTGSLFFLLVAAAALVSGDSVPETALRVVLFLVGSVFLYLGLKTAVPGLYRAVSTLRRMSLGFVTLGRIVSCRLVWDGKRAEMPYREFLEDWLVNISRSQTRKFFGCLATTVLVVFVGPFALIALMVAMVFVAGSLGVPPDAATPGGLDGWFVAKWIAGSLFFIALVLLMLGLTRRSLVRQVVPYMEWLRVAQPGRNAVYDDDGARLVALAKEAGTQISLKEPLPVSYGGVELVCKVEYSVVGEPCTATARARFSNRLNPAGVEQLIFSPTGREKVDLFVGLPDGVRVDAEGRWSDVPAIGPAVQLTLTGAVGLVALAAFWWNVSALNVLFR